MIHFLSGKPRGGKTFWALHLLIEQLTTTDRFVVTNLKIYLDELQEYLDAKGYNIHVLDRVRMLTDEEAKNFWLYRYDYDLPTPSDYAVQKGADSNVDYTPLFTDTRWFVGNTLVGTDGKPSPQKGHAYFIDEIHTLSPSRAWTSTPRHLLFYNSQHGKLGDECFFISQSTGLVEKQILVLCQDFTYVRNHRLEKYGWFRGDDKFSYKVYPRAVTSPNDLAMHGGTFPLEKAMADCYDTSAGVGMPGGSRADNAARAKGAPLKLVILAGAAVLGFSFWFFTFGLGGLTKRILGPALAPQQMARLVPAAKLPGASSTPATDLTDKPAAPAGPGVRVAFGAKRPEIVGVWIARVDGMPVVHAQLENGQDIPPRWISAFNLEEGQEWVEAKGVRYFLKRPAITSPKEDKPRPAGLEQAAGTAVATLDR